MSAVQAPWLTQTKFIPPRLREDLVPRQRLLDGLHAAVNVHALTLVSASAGYGKTTLINETLALLGEPWVVLDDLYLITDPAIFFRARLPARANATTQALDRRRAPRFTMGADAIARVDNSLRCVCRICVSLRTRRAIFSTRNKGWDCQRNPQLNDARLSDMSLEIFECLILCW